MQIQRRAERGSDPQARDPNKALRYLTPPASFEVKIGVVARGIVDVRVTRMLRGMPPWAMTTRCELDLEGRLPAATSAELYRALVGFLEDEVTQRIGSTLF